MTTPSSFDPSGPGFIYRVLCSYGTMTNQGRNDGLFCYAATYRHEDAQALKALAISKGYKDAKIKAEKKARGPGSDSRAAKGARGPANPPGPNRQGAEVRGLRTWA